MSTTPADAVLNELRRRGVDVVADGDRIKFRPADLVDDDLRARIRRCKAQLLVLLRESSNPDRTTPCACCGSRDFWALTHVRHWVCARCHAPDYNREQLVWITVAGGGPVHQPHANNQITVACLSCGGVHFVRLKNGRRSVCARCERVSLYEIDGPDDGLIGPPLGQEVAP